MSSRHASRLDDRVRFATLGLAYGFGLVVWGIILAGAGHGNRDLLDHVAAAPFAGGFLAMFGAPLMWAIMGVLLADITRRRTAIIFLALMGLHYFSIVPAFGALIDLGWGPTIYYTLGQVGIWIVALTKVFKAKAEDN